MEKQLICGYMPDHADQLQLQGRSPWRSLPGNASQSLSHSRVQLRDLRSYTAVNEHLMSHITMLTEQSLRIHKSEIRSIVAKLEGHQHLERVDQQRHEAMTRTEGQAALANQLTSLSHHQISTTVIQYWVLIHFSLTRGSMGCTHAHIQPCSERCFEHYAAALQAQTMISSINSGPPQPSESGAVMSHTSKRLSKAFTGTVRSSQSRAKLEQPSSSGSHLQWSLNSQ